MSELRLKSTGTIKLFENDNTSNVTIASPASLGADRTITLHDASVTLASGTMLATDGSGASLTALNASELGSGTVPTARLGSGTASSSTILYGDQTYKAEPAAGKINQITRTFTTAGNSSVGTTSTTYEDSGITVSITPSATDSVIIVDFACAMSQYYETVVGQTSLYRAIGAGADTEVTTAAYKWSYINYPLTTSDTIYAPMFLRFIDTTHNTTSACAYKIYFLTTNASYQYTLAHSNTTYSMIATEVLA